jgi:hypothetical protein
MEFQESAKNPLHFTRFRLLSELETEGLPRLADDCGGDGSAQVESLLKFSGLMNRQQANLNDTGELFIFIVHHTT